MAMNIDSIMNNAKSVLRGEASGSVRFLAVFLSMLAVWAGVLTVSGWNAQSLNSLKSQEGRRHTLLLGNAGQEVDVAAVFAQVSERMELGSRVNRITPDGRNQSVEINRLYAEELAELQRELASRGVRFIAAELRALPSGQERLMTVSAIIGPME